MYIAVEPLFALIAGILILIVPRILNYVVAIYLILVGLFGILHARDVRHTVSRPAAVAPPSYGG